MTQYTEQDLILPALVLLETNPSGLTTSDLIDQLTAVLQPDGRDAEILAGRGDTYFSQKVRNLVSHRTLERPGLEVYDGSRQHHSITAAGRQYLRNARDRGEIEGRFGTSPVLAASTVFPSYRAARETVASQPREPFSVDPNVIDRALGAHAATQNALAAWVRANGMTPVSSASSALDFDLAWEDNRRLNVAEVKSLSADNETRQLRLGLGQVLDYAGLLSAAGRDVRPVLAVEHEPYATRWGRLCAEHGVALVWPLVFDQLASEP